jgi:AcrR family transcriptional regulator
LRIQARPATGAAKKSYHHGNLPEALRNAVRDVLDAGDIEQVGMREVARIVGVSASAAYRHFEGKDDLLASVAADGFRELAAALKAAADDPAPMMAIGFAYVDFAVANPGVFGLMFGPHVARKENHSDLKEAAAGVFRVLARTGVFGKDRETRRRRALAAWSVIHGFSTLIVVNFLSVAKAKALMRDIFAETNPTGSDPVIGF